MPLPLPNGMRLSCGAAGNGASRSRSGGIRSHWERAPAAHHHRLAQGSSVLEGGLSARRARGCSPNGLQPTATSKEKEADHARANPRLKLTARLD